MKKSHQRCINVVSQFDADIKRYAAKIIARRADDPENDSMIVLLGVDEEFGGKLADIVIPMPDSHWQKFRDLGLEPFANGIIPRAIIQLLLDKLGLSVAKDLRKIQGIPILVSYNGAVAVLEIPSN